MKCPKCKKKLEKVNVKVYGAKTRALSYQCGECPYILYDPVTSKKVIGELRANPPEKLIKLSNK